MRPQTKPSTAPVQTGIHGEMNVPGLSRPLITFERVAKVIVLFLLTNASRRPTPVPASYPGFPPSKTPTTPAITHE